MGTIYRRLSDGYSFSDATQYRGWIKGRGPSLGIVPSGGGYAGCLGVARAQGNSLPISIAGRVCINFFFISNQAMSETPEQIIEADPATIDDVEEDDCASSGSGSTMTLMSAARSHVYENGRRFHGWREVRTHRLL